MFGAQVLIVRRPKLYCTVSGIIAPIGVMIPETVQYSFNNNIYLLQLGCNPVAVVILHVYKT